MAEITEAVPANAPWLSDWKTVAKASGSYEEKPKEDVGVVETIKRTVKPWLMEWGVIAKEGEKNAPKPSQMPSSPPLVDVSTEAKMKRAVVIQPHERQPDTQSLSSNLAEIDLEIKNAKHKNIKDILIAQRNTMTKGM